MPRKESTEVELDVVPTQVEPSLVETDGATGAALTREQNRAQVTTSNICGELGKPGEGSGEGREYFRRR